MDHRPRCRLRTDLVARGLEPSARLDPAELVTSPQLGSRRAKCEARTTTGHPQTWGRNARIEVIATLVILAIIVAFVALFLFVYHDIPFRLG